MKGKGDKGKKEERERKKGRERKKRKRFASSVLLLKEVIFELAPASDRQIGAKI